MAPRVRVEANEIASKVLLKGVAAGDNLVIHAIGRSAHQLRSLVGLLTERGYDVHLTLVDVPTDVAAQRVVTRLRETGRFTDPAEVLEVGTAPREAFDAVKLDREVVTHEMWSNDVERGQPPHRRD